MKARTLITLAVFFLIRFSFGNTYYVFYPGNAGYGSLRAAIDSANINHGADSIILMLTANDTINITNDLQPITGPLIITGQVCQNPTITGGGFRPAFVTNSALTLNYVNIITHVSL